MKLLCFIFGHGWWTSQHRLTFKWAENGDKAYCRQCGALIYDKTGDNNG